jgi:hypothetical protein
MDTSNANAELWAALAAAQADIQNPTKNAVNPHFKNKYADLAEVLKTVLPVFSSHKLAIIQSTGFDSATNVVSVSTVVAHAGGGFVSSEARCIPGKTDAQGVGAATTYLRRYSLSAMAGVAQEDDDGNSAKHERKHHEPSQALLAILAKIQSFLTVEGLESIKPEIRALSPAERSLAIQAGIERKQWIEAGQEDTDG